MKIRCWVLGHRPTRVQRWGYSIRRCMRCLDYVGEPVLDPPAVDGPVEWPVPVNVVLGED